MEPPLLLLKAAAIALAYIAGWCLARSVPGWQLDYYNEMGVQGDETSLHPLLAFFQGAGGALILLAFFQGAGGALILFVASQALGVLGWQEQIYHDLSLTADTYGMEILLTHSFWILIVVTLAGYVVSRLGDKGPVGPLE